MCAILGISQGWWNISGIVLEIVGFLILFVVTLRDVDLRLALDMFGENPFSFPPSDAKGEERKQEMQARINVLHVAIYGPIYRRLVVGAIFVMIGLGVQIPGNWPC
jgi:hypothetical protein